MVNDVNVAIGLIGHHGHLDDIEPDTRIIKAVSIDKGIPITYLLTGVELDEIQRNRNKLQSRTWFDIVDEIRNSGKFINPGFGNFSPGSSELGISTYNHVPAVHPMDDPMWEFYFNTVVQNQIHRSKRIAEKEFGITPRTFHPPDGIYSPAAAHTIKNAGLDTTLVSSEHFWSANDKGKVYFASGLRHAVRTNDIQPQNPKYWEGKPIIDGAYHFIEDVKSYAHKTNSGFVIVTCDIDEFSGKRGVRLHHGIERLCAIGDAAHNTHGLNLININAASHQNINDGGDLTNVWGNWNNVFAMMNGNGDLSFIHGEKNARLGELLRKMEGRSWDGHDISTAIDRFSEAGDSACRNGWWGDCLTGYFDSKVSEAYQAL